MAKLETKISGIDFKNPVTVASGTFGYGTEFSDFFDVSLLGGIFVKGTTLYAQEGNPYSRMAETPSGMLNAVGLQNKGVDYFVNNIYPTIKDIDTNMIVNVGGTTIESYVKCPSKSLTSLGPSARNAFSSFLNFLSSSERIYLILFLLSIMKWKK